MKRERRVDSARSQSREIEEDDRMQVLLLRVTEVAAQLGISRAKVYQLIGRGSLPAVKVDGCRRIRAEDLREFVAQLNSVA